jgi:hypothetical protein
MNEVSMLDAPISLKTPTNQKTLKVETPKPMSNMEDIRRDILQMKAELNDPWNMPGDEPPSKFDWLTLMSLRKRSSSLGEYPKDIEGETFPQPALPVGEPHSPAPD